MWDKEIAKLIKGNKKIKGYGPIIGKIISPPPEIKISALSGKLILSKSYLYINDFLLSQYKRDISIDGQITFIDENCGETDLVNDGGYNASLHLHEIVSLEVDTDYEAEATINLVDTLKINDEVLLLPTESGQKFFIVCKVKQLG